MTLFVLKYVCVHLQCLYCTSLALCEHTDVTVCCVSDVCLCVYTPVLKYFSRSPSIPSMGQQVSRSLARTLPVLFLTNWLPRRGCQSSQPFPFIQQHYSHCGPSFTFLSRWYEKIQFDVSLSYTGCIFHNHFVQFHMYFMCILEFFGRCHWLTKKTLLIWWV